MENYFTFTQLLGLRDSEGANLPIFKDARVKRYQSVEKMLGLLEIASQTRPFVPSVISTLNPLDRNSTLIQLNGTIRCPSLSLTAIVIGPTPEEFHPSSYFDINLVLLLLQLQHFLNEHSLPHFQKCIPILGRLHFC